MAAPLEGVVVLDCSRLYPGPYATQILADLGARVVKIEEPGPGDYLRHMEPMAGEHSAMFLALNRGKESVALDMRSDDGKDAFRRLVKDAHVVVESFRPGVMDRLKVGYEDLRKVNPGIILCAISGYGKDGPDALKAGHDINYLARAGVLGYAGSPSPLPVQIADVAGGSLWAVIQVLAALRRREQTGEGAFIDVSMTDGAWAMLSMTLGGALAGGVAMKPGGDLLNGGVACYRVYKAQDGVAVAVGALEPKFWQGFCDAVDRPDLVDKGHSAAGIPEVEALIASKPSSHWREVFQKADCCVEVCNPPERAHVDDPQLRTRNLTVRVEQPGSGNVELPVTPLRISGYEPRFNRPAPALGADSARIMRDGVGGKR